MIADALTWIAQLVILYVVLQLAAEVTFGCHCRSWAWTEHGARCSQPIDLPRCELISGWHPIAAGINTCSKGNCDD